jgi:hypothetical protein
MNIPNFTTDQNGLETITTILEPGTLGGIIEGPTLGTSGSDVCAAVSSESDGVVQEGKCKRRYSSYT